MLLKFKIFSLFSLLLLCSSCDVFEIHPYDGKVTGDKNINLSNIKIIEDSFANSDTLRFAFISDSQRWYDELEAFVKHINKQQGIDFVVHGGDLTDFGLTKEFLWQRDILNKMNYPYVTLIGNHDYLANGDEVFAKVFGPVNFSFIAGRTKFLCLNTNALESNYSEPIPDFSFIENQSKQNQGEYDKTVVFMHAQPKSEQFNNNVADLFQYSIKQFPNVLFCAHGHGHHYQAVDIFQDGLMYYETPNIGKRQYILFTITQDSYTHELIDY